MIKKFKRSINDVLNDPEHSLGKIIQKAKSIEALQKQLQSELPHPIANHTFVGTYDKGILTLLVDSAAIATQLRFTVPDIREKLRKQPQWYGLKSINVKIIVNPPNLFENKTKNNEKTEHNTLQISDKSAKLLQEVANTIDETNGGDRLKEALMRLAKYGKN